MRKDGQTPSNARTVLGFVVVFVLIVLGLAFTSSLPRRVVGVVQSSGMRYVGKYNDGLRRVALIRLANGNVVSAYDKSAEPASTGDIVTLSKQPVVLGNPIYTVVAKNKL